MAIKNVSVSRCFACGKEIEKPIELKAVPTCMRCGAELGKCEHIETGPMMTMPIGMTIGISLRDWFAGMALAHQYTHDEMPNQTEPDDTAILAYRIADAMLNRREAK